MASLRFPVAIRPRGKGSGLLFADLSDRPVLRGRWPLTNERALAVPRDIVRSSPTVSTPHPLPVLNRHIGHDIIVQAANRPAVMRFACGVLIARFAIKKDIRSADASADNKGVSPRLHLTS